MKPVRLTRTRWDTFRWYATTRAGKIGILTLLIVAVVVGLGVWQLSSASGTANPAVHSNTLGVAQTSLNDQISTSQQTADSATGIDAKVLTPLTTALDTCRTLAGTSATAGQLDRCTAALKKVTAPVSAAVKDAAKPAPTKATSTPKATPAKPAPTANQTVTVTCTTASTVTFIAEGTGDVTVSVSGPSNGSGQGRNAAFVTVAGAAGQYIGTAADATTLTASWSGACTK